MSDPARSSLGETLFVVLVGALCLGAAYCDGATRGECVVACLKAGYQPSECKSLCTPEEKGGCSK